LAGTQGFVPILNERGETKSSRRELRCDGNGGPATNEAEGRMKWLGVRDDFRSWLLTAA